MMEYQIRLYKSDILIWCGFLDSELYSEPFNITNNYTVTFTGTDGFALLNRIYYLDSNGSKYTGLMTQWTIIVNILSKLNLPFKNIYIGLSTTSDDFTIGSNESIFHQTFSNNQNWYNEDNDAETTRTVLENILKPYAAIILQDNANIFITDINILAGATTASFLKYDSSFNYISTDSINLNLGDLSSIKFATNNQQLNVISGFNKQVVKYSPYINSEILDFNAETDFSTPLTALTYGTSPYQWQETTYLKSNSFTSSYNGAFASYKGLQEANLNAGDSYLRIKPYTVAGAIPANLSFRLKKELPYFIPSDSKLKISCKAYMNTVADLNGNTNTNICYLGKLNCRVKIGDKQFYRD
ncbi:MAG: hypothetical protein WAO52_02935 [Prolixibacteraceae bacterium]